MTSNFVGSWKLEVVSPLGLDQYTLSITETMSASIHEMRGSMTFDDVKINSNNFEMLGTTLTPTKARVMIAGSILNGLMSGKIYINDYCQVSFNGTKNG